MEEIWKDLPDSGNRYQGSNLGRIRNKDLSIVRSDGKPYTTLSKVISSQVCRIGYETIKISDGTTTKRKKVHRLIALAFVENPENKKEVNHKDGVKTNNIPSNLEWVTRSENMKHAVKTGLLINAKGESNGFSKLTKSDVIKIKHLFIIEKSDYRIAKLFGVHGATIYKIRHGKNWNHITI